MKVLKFINLFILGVIAVGLIAFFNRYHTNIRQNERLTIQIEQLTEANHRLVEEIGETLPDWGEE